MKRNAERRNANKLEIPKVWCHVQLQNRLMIRVECFSVSRSQIFANMYSRLILRIQITCFTQSYKANLLKWLRLRWPSLWWHSSMEFFFLAEFAWFEFGCGVDKINEYEPSLSFTSSMMIIVPFFIKKQPRYPPINSEKSISKFFSSNTTEVMFNEYLGAW